MIIDFYVISVVLFRCKIISQKNSKMICRSNTTICAAQKCYNSLLTHPTKSFFGFPSDISLCKIWLENCGRTDLNLQNVSKRRYCRLCEDHFEDKWFTDSTKKVLKRKLNPIPTIFVNNINSLLPPGNEPGSINDSCLLSNSVQHVTEIENEIFVNSRCSDKQNIDDICRFCLNEVTFNFVDMYADTDDARDIREVSLIILPNKASVDDGLPHKVCHQCRTDIKTCLKLIKQFQNADQYLRSIAKYSSLIDHHGVEMSMTNEQVGEEIIIEEFKSIKNPIMILQSSPNTTTNAESYELLTEMIVDEPSDVKNNLNASKCIKQYMNRNLNHLMKKQQCRGNSIDTTLHLKKHKQLIKKLTRFKNCKNLSSEVIINKTTVMAEDNTDYNHSISKTHF